MIAAKRGHVDLVRQEYRSAHICEECELCSVIVSSCLFNWFTIPITVRTAGCSVATRRVEVESVIHFRVNPTARLVVSES